MMLPVKMVLNFKTKNDFISMRRLVVLIIRTIPNRSLSLEMVFLIMISTLTPNKFLFELLLELVLFFI